MNQKKSLFYTIRTALFVLAMACLIGMWGAPGGLNMQVKAQTASTGSGRGAGSDTADTDDTDTDNTNADGTDADDTDADGTGTADTDPEDTETADQSNGNAIGDSTDGEGNVDTSDESSGDKNTGDTETEDEVISDTEDSGSNESESGEGASSGSGEETTTEAETTAPEETTEATTAPEETTEATAVSEETASDKGADTDTGESGGISVLFVAVIAVILLALICVAAYLALRMRSRGREEKEAVDSAIKEADNWDGDVDENMQAEDEGQDSSAMVEAGSAEDSRIGKVHNIGKRRNQQDTLGVGMTPHGLLAVVSDGMGGLADGEKVSQTAVKTMLQSAQANEKSSLPNPLYELLAQANQRVLRMLGPDRIYKSGATLLAVLVSNGAFHWVAVGDSRIYFYDGDHLIQMNGEHVFKRELIVQAVNGKLDFARIETNTQKGGLVSFLGMGDLKYVDGSLTPLKLAKGDRILLMSDGIFNTISEDQILSILKKSKTAAEAAGLMEKSVLDAANPKQDNFTCVILDA